MIGPRRFERARFAEVPLLRGVPDAIYKRLSERGKDKTNAWDSLYEVSFSAGETILREGEYCDGAYYIMSGVVEVLFRGSGAGPPAKPRAKPLIARLRERLGRAAAAPDPAAPRRDDTVVLEELPIDLRVGDRAVLSAGEIFGEGSALSRYPIATDIVAVSAVTCLLIRTPLLRALFDQEEFASFKKFFDDRYRQRTLRAHLKRVPIFQNVDQSILDEIAERAELVSFDPDDIVVKQGDAADALYLVRGGYLKVGLQLGASEVAVSYLRKGDVAGEAGLLLGEPWPFTLSALENVELVKISFAQMRAVLASRPEVEQRLWEAMVAGLKRRSMAAEKPLGMQYMQYAMDSGLIHGESVLLIDLDTCTRCDDCVRACAETHNGVPRFIREGSRFRNFSVPTACYHCTDPVCMIGCPTGAITRPLGTLEVTIDPITCIGCENCVRRCPWDNIQTIPFENLKGKLATKCDLCIGRADGPACVQMCPHGAAVRVNFKEQERVEGLLSR